MAHYLVTGGCGFIGSHLCAALVARGDRVRVLDDLSTGSRANLAPGAGLVVGDVADPAVVQGAMQGVDGCFHLAAIASVERAVREWLATHRVNLSATIGVFDAARAVGPVPVVYASSAAVYGDQETLPIAEDAPKRPLSAYGADKLGCEQQALVAGHVHQVPTMGLRFFNVFGPRQDPKSPYSGVISIFCDRLSAGQPVQVFGDGGRSRHSSAHNASEGVSRNATGFSFRRPGRARPAAVRQALETKAATAKPSTESQPRMHRIVSGTRYGLFIASVSMFCCQRPRVIQN